MKLVPLLVLLAAVFACSQQPKPVVKTEKTPAPTVPPTRTATPEKVLSTTVETYTAEFASNEVAATERYKDKLVEMDGVVDSVTSSWIKFEGTDAIAVICRYTDATGVKSLRKGQRVTVEGRSMGITLGVYASLSDCRVK